MTGRRLAFALLLACGLAVAGPAPGGADLLLPDGGGLLLGDAMAAALAGDPRLAAADQRLAAADAGTEAAEAVFLPRLDLQLSSGAGWIDFQDAAGLSDGAYWPQQAVVQLRQRLWDAGSSTGGAAAAAADVERAQAVAAQTGEDLALAVSNAYLDALAAETLVRQSEETLALHRRILGLVAEQERGGAATPADRVQAAGRVALAEATLAADRGRLAMAVARLESLTGLRLPAGAGRGEAVAGLALPPLPSDRLPPSAAAALLRATDRSPLLAALRAEGRRWSAEAEAAAARGWPTIDFVLLGRAAHGLPGVEGPLLEAAGLVQLRWRLFDGFGVEAEVRRLSALRGASAYALDDRRRLLAETIARAYGRLESLAGRLAALDAAVAAQEEVAALYAQQFGLGERALLELLDAQRELDRLRRLSLTALIERVRATHAVAHAMGELRDWLLEPAQASVAPGDVAALSWRAPAPPPVATDLAAAEAGRAGSAQALVASLGGSDADPPPPVPPVLAVPPPGAGRHGSGPTLEQLLLGALGEGPAEGGPAGEGPAAFARAPVHE